MSLRKKTVQGVIWSFVSFGSSKLLTFITTIILTRLLVPELFGQVALALVTISGFEAIGFLGMAGALIYQRDNIERAAHVAFTISVVMGVILWATITLCAPLVGAYYGDPAVTSLLRGLAFTFIIGSFGSVHSALLTKELNFKRRLVPNIARTFVKGSTSIALALSGWGAWSLVWGQILGDITAVIALWIIQPFRPRLLWDTQLGRTMLLYGIQVIGVEIMSFFYTNADYIVVGKVLGPADLAVYRQAFTVSNLLILSFCAITAHVLFPSYAKLNHNQEALQKGFLTTLRYISLITLPLSIGLCAVAPLFVRMVFTEAWYGMSLPLQWLALRAGVNTLSFHAGSVFRAIGRPVIITKLIVVRIIILVPIILFSVQFGIIGIAVGQVCMAIIETLLDFRMVHRVIHVSPRHIWQSTRPALIAAMGMGSAVWLFAMSVPQTSVLVTLIGSMSLGAVVYLGLLWLIERQLMRDSLRLVLDMLPLKGRTMAKQEG